MSSINIPITIPTQRTDGTALAASEIAFIDMFMSIDNGQNYVSIGHAAADQVIFTVDVPGPGTYLFRAETVDTQAPSPRTSSDSATVSFTVAPPVLAAPNPPVLGTPVAA